MTLRSYRVCILDTEGHIVLSRTTGCVDDLAALAEAENDSSGHAVEVWGGPRLVARVKADNAPLDASDHTSL